MAAQNHIHKYRRKPYGSKGRTIYACILPNCTHFQLEKRLLVGKESLCNECNLPFIITADLVAREGMVKLRCRDCRENHKMGGPKKFREQAAKKKEKTASLDNALDKLRTMLDLDEL